MEKYYLVIMLINQADQDSPTICAYADKTSALVEYHNTLASYHNAPDVKYAIVQIVNGYGNCEIMGIVNHIPAPEPEPEPAPEE